MHAVGLTSSGNEAYWNVVVLAMRLTNLADLLGHVGLLAAFIIAWRAATRPNPTDD